MAVAYASHCTQRMAALQLLLTEFDNVSCRQTSPMAHLIKPYKRDTLVNLLLEVRSPEIACVVVLITNLMSAGRGTQEAEGALSWKEL